MDQSEEESFSLSSFDFNSSFGLYSSDEEENDSDKNKDINNDFDAYIEYELRPPPPPQGIDEELEFRVSFSTFVPFPGFQPASPIIEDPAVNIFFSKLQYSFTSNDSNCDLGSTPVVGLESPRRELSVNDGNRDDYDDCRTNNWKLVPSSKASSSNTITVTNGGITNLVLKLKSIILSLRSIRTSCNSRPRRPESPNRRRSWRCINLMKPFEKLCNWRTNNQQLMVVRKNNGGFERSSPSSKVVLEELKLNVLRKLFVNGGNKLIRRVEITKSCPNSIKSSPVHQSSDASSSSSVCAAIAHCKKSLGRADEFCF
ncbi:hypothetical protein ACJIZ3_024505 [Penstemon smallii]|uniref:Uncharacterized protein n=1 Tax=Penstemon smallii TaxID=265156 RepID=A0ABD3TS31_9LAMI